MVDHNADVFGPLQIRGDEDPEVLERGDSHDVVVFCGVLVLGTPDLTTSEVGLSGFGEDHEFSLCQVC